MSEPTYGAFIVKIMTTLEQHGYPKKKVSLPLEQMYEAAYKKSLNFNKVLEFLLEKGIDHSKTEEKIIFFPRSSSDASEAESITSQSSRESKERQNPFGDMFGSGAFDWQKMAESFGNLSMGEIMLKAQELMKSMNPEDIARIQENFENLSPDQKKDLMDQAKKMMGRDPDKKS